MSESKLRKTATQKLINQFPHCAICGNLRPTTTREHCPPKSLFLTNYRPDGFVAPSCQECQDKTRTADLVVSIISRWGYAPDEDISCDHPRLSARLRSQAPEIIKEWTSLNLIERKKARRHLEQRKIYAPGNNIARIGPKTIPHLNIFSQKFSLVSYFEITGKPVPKNGRIWATWRTKEDIQSNPIPQEIKNTLGPLWSIRQGKWDSKKHFQFRHSYNSTDDIFMIYARFNISFFVIAFVAANGGFHEGETDWFSPETAFEQAAIPKRIS